MREIMNWLKSWKLSLISTSTVLLAFNICTNISQAQPAAAEIPTEVDMKMGCPIECEPWPEKLGLTDEQMEKLITLKSEYEIKNAERKAQLMANMKQMALLMTEDKADKNVILSLNDKNNAIKAELSVARINRMIEAMSIMTPKQKEQIHHNMLVHMLSHQTGDFHHHRMKKHY